MVSKRISLWAIKCENVRRFSQVIRVFWALIHTLEVFNFFSFYVSLFE